jgi:ATP-dependent RNA helicase DeaD
MSSETPLAQSFDQLPLSDHLLDVLNEIGYAVPTPVQSGSIPHAIEGRDLMVQSQTGTGKTAAFSIPIIERLAEAEGISALVLAPTRELARQVAEEARRLSAGRDGFDVICVYGGVPIDRQIEEIKRAPKMIVGTPGRVIDHLRRKTLKLHQVQCFVLDEADEMLSMGFAEELEEVLRYLPKSRQTLFFSATFPASVKRYAARVLQDPLLLSFLDESSSADDLEHRYCLVKGVARGRHLVNLIRESNPESALVFTNTRRDAERVSKLLNREGIEAGKLSGDMD